MQKYFKTQPDLDLGQEFRSPPDVNGAVTSLIAPAVPGPGACTPPAIKVGSHVRTAGMVCKVARISSRGVVTLNHTCGGFCKFSHLSVLELVK